MNQNESMLGNALTSLVTNTIKRELLYFFKEDHLLFKRIETHRVSIHSIPETAEVFPPDSDFYLAQVSIFVRLIQLCSFYC
jgi:hypothetical protein